MAIVNSSVTVDEIRGHYDQITYLYRALWGEHIHHGYWNGNESPAVAQVQLIEQVARAAAIKPGAVILDVGCGVGGSSIWLAKNLGCTVVGLTLSPAQAEIAAEQAAAAEVETLTRFFVHDANELSLTDASFDHVWVIECSEHLADKGKFFQEAIQCLRPGGTIAVCGWLRGPNLEAGEGLVRDVAERMLCPSLGTMDEYKAWMRESGFTSVTGVDLTPRVKKTWDYCTVIANRPEVKLLLHTVDERTRRFVESFSMMKDAYDVGAMSYGLFTARKPGGAEPA